MPSSSSVSPPDGGRRGTAEEGGGGGKLDEGVEVAAGLGLAWAFEATETPSLNTKTNQKHFRFPSKITLTVCW